MIRDSRNTLTSYLLFLYGIALLPLFLICFKSGASEVSIITIIGFAILAALTTSMLFSNLSTGWRYGKRTLIYWLVLTLINLFIWLMMCDGTFILRD